MDSDTVIDNHNESSYENKIKNPFRLILSVKLKENNCIISWIVLKSFEEIYV